MIGLADSTTTTLKTVLAGVYCADLGSCKQIQHIRFVITSTLQALACPNWQNTLEGCLLLRIMPACSERVRTWFV